MKLRSHIKSIQATGRSAWVLTRQGFGPRHALLWLGGLTLIPAAVWVAQAGIFANGQLSMPRNYYIFGWITAFLLPLALAWWLRVKHAWLNVVAALWVAALSTTRLRYQEHSAVWKLDSYALFALGSIGLIAWGLKESRKERVNLGIAGFALTVLFFYFSSVMDKLGRSASLIGLGLLFLLGGWILEKTRRRLIDKIGEGAA